MLMIGNTPHMHEDDVMMIIVIIITSISTVVVGTIVVPTHLPYLVGRDAL